MEHEQITRFIWEKEELRRLLIKDLEKRGFNVQGESKLTLNPLAVVFEVDVREESNHGQGEVFEQG